MRVAAVSDFHIGADDRTCAFGHDLGAFETYLDRLERSHDLIVLLGDIFQTEHAAIPGRKGAAEQLKKALRRLGALAARLTSNKYRYVFGNHDEVAQHELGAEESLTLHADGMTLHMLHGHQFDPLLQGRGRIAKTGTWINGRLRALGLHGVSQWVEQLDHRYANIAHGDDGNGSYVKQARQVLARHNADVVLMGHTHVAHRTDVPEGVVVNTGTCIERQFCAVSIDTQTRQIAISKNIDLT